MPDSDTASTWILEIIATKVNGMAEKSFQLELGPRLINLSTNLCRRQDEIRSLFASSPVLRRLYSKDATQVIHIDCLYPNRALTTVDMKWQ